MCNCIKLMLLKYEFLINKKYGQVRYSAKGEVMKEKIVTLS